MKLLICGPGASGKTTFGKQLERRGLNTVIQHTTRPKRDGEEDKVDYFFVDEKDYNFLKEHHMVETQEFSNGWQYGTTKASWDRGDFLIVNPKSISQLRDSVDDKLFIIYLDIDIVTRRNRLSIRQDADKVQRRLDQDFGDFQNFVDFDLRITDSNFVSSDDDYIQNLLLGE